MCPPAGTIRVATATWLTGCAPVAGALTRTAAAGGADTAPARATAPPPARCAQTAKGSAKTTAATISIRRIAAPCLYRAFTMPSSTSTRMRLALERFQDPPLPVPVRDRTRRAAQPYPLDPLFPRSGLCYNLRAVERAAKEGATPAYPEHRRVDPEPGASFSLKPVPGRAESDAQSANPEKDSAAPNEDHSRYCPVCSQRLTSRRCKLICTVCGYYMSCADYY